MNIIIPACICFIALCLIYRLTEDTYATLAAALIFLVMEILEVQS